MRLCWNPVLCHCLTWGTLTPQHLLPNIRDLRGKGARLKAKELLSLRSSGWVLLFSFSYSSERINQQVWLLHWLRHQNQSRIWCRLSKNELSYCLSNADCHSKTKRALICSHTISKSILFPTKVFLKRTRTRNGSWFEDSFSQLERRKSKEWVRIIDLVGLRAPSINENEMHWG